MMLNIRKFLAVCFALMLPCVLAGCGEEKAVVGKTSAGGEILDRSISDEMLPLDSVRSQPPLAPKAGGSSVQGDDEKDDKAPEDKPKPAAE